MATNQNMGNYSLSSVMNDNLRNMIIDNIHSANATIATSTTGCNATAQYNPNYPTGGTSDPVCPHCHRCPTCGQSQYPQQWGLLGGQVVLCADGTNTVQAGSTLSSSASMGTKGDSSIPKTQLNWKTDNHYPAF